MDASIKIYIFGDQSDDIREALGGLIASSRDPILESFLAQSYRAIRSEISRVPQAPSLLTPRSSSLLDLLNFRCDGVWSIALDHALTTVCQLGLSSGMLHLPPCTTQS